MRIYANAYELMSEMGRNLWEMGLEVKPKSYQNKDIQGNDDFITKELICEQYCLTKLPDPECLFVFSDTNNWADEEFKERILPTMDSVNPGEAWKLREEVWTEFLNKDNKFDYTYHDRINERLLITIDDTKAHYTISIIDNVIRELKRNPDTRQAIIPIFNSKDVGGIGGAFRIPCSMYYDFLLIIYVMADNFHQAKLLGLAFRYYDHIDTERNFKIGIFIKHFQYRVDIRFFLQANDRAHTLSIRFVRDVENICKFFFLFFTKHRNLLQKLRLVYLIRKFGNNQIDLTAIRFFNINLRADCNFSPTRFIRLNELVGDNDTARREIGRRDIPHHLF